MSAADGEETALELQRWGTRFTDPDVERAYRDWQFARTLPQLRVLIAATLAIWIVLPAILVGTGEFRPEEMFAYGPFIWPPMLLGFFALARRRAAWWRAYWTFGTGCWSSATIVAISGHQSFDDGGMVLLSGAAAGTIVGASTDGVGVALPCGVILVGGAQALRMRLWADGSLSGVAVLYEAFSMWALLAVGCVVAVNADRASHAGYRQERIIEAQKATIARERARSEELLKRELSHQVAERSRELGAVLEKSDVTLDARALSPGERFADRYRIVSRLGEGGMGTVYEVERVTDGAKLALKAVAGEVGSASAARFAREAEIGARVRHPNLVSIVDVGVSTGVPFLVMELVRGGSLESQRARFGDVVWALPVLAQIADGLTALHAAGVVHRDLKPANVLLTESGAKISDFGISRFGGPGEGASIDPSGDTMAATPKRSSALTGTGVVMGTPLYMAPEGATSARALDASADVFAFGIIAHEMLTGRAPFVVPAVLLAMAEQPIPQPGPVEPAGVSHATASLLSRALAVDPAKRPRMRELIATLAQAPH